MTTTTGSVQSLTHLVDFAITNAACACKPAAEGGSEGRRPGNAARTRNEGRASRCSREGGNAAIDRLLSAQLMPIGRNAISKVDVAADTYLLNILQDDEQRLRMGWEVVLKFAK
jgi:hypothetical protein